MTCEHKKQDTTDSGRLYCTDCGERMLDHGTPTYYQALANSRSLLWSKLGKHGYIAELGKTYIGARYNEGEKRWMLSRVIWCDDCGQFEVQQDGLSLDQRAHMPAHVTHIAPDLLGAPHDHSEQATLSSSAA
jgi:DNA-directed RNA polymerase subunit RPC12/RpoP